MNPPRLSIILPALNEAATIAHALHPLQCWRQHGLEIIVVDGGSNDATTAVAAPLADRVIVAARGRAAQMNAGAALARAELLLFLHADTQLPLQAFYSVISAAEMGAVWGRFDVRIAGQLRGLVMVAFMMNWRSCITGIATGDQAMFVRKQLFEAVGGFPPIPLMEDIALSKTLRALAPPVCLRETVTTSGRRWEKHGLWRTIFLMWALRLRYALGTDPAKLAKRYGYRAPE
jgi:rSAM/selenodomain-associated transferase 2